MTNAIVPEHVMAKLRQLFGSEQTWFVDSYTHDKEWYDIKLHFVKARTYRRRIVLRIPTVDSREPQS